MVTLKISGLHFRNYKALELKIGKFITYIGKTCIMQRFKRDAKKRLFLLRKKPDASILTSPKNSEKLLREKSFCILQRNSQWQLDNYMHCLIHLIV